jgi:hypothetical protein
LSVCAVLAGAVSVDAILGRAVWVSVVWVHAVFGRAVLAVRFRWCGSRSFRSCSSRAFTAFHYFFNPVLLLGLGLFLNSSGDRFLGRRVYIHGQWSDCRYMNQHDAAKYQEFLSFHPHREEEDRVDELIAFFYDLVRDEPRVLAKVDAAMRERYGYVHDDQS